VAIKLSHNSYHLMQQSINISDVNFVKLNVGLNASETCLGR
jgi:hypothetical protein